MRYADLNYVLFRNESNAVAGNWTRATALARQEKSTFFKHFMRFLCISTSQKRQQQEIVSAFSRFLCACVVPFFFFSSVVVVVVVVDYILYILLLLYFSTKLHYIDVVEYWSTEFSTGVLNCIFFLHFSTKLHGGGFLGNLSGTF